MWQGLGNENTMFPLMRLLLPQLDIERPGYQVKEKKIANLYVQAIPLQKGSVDAFKLLRYKNPKYAGNNVGDFGNVLFDVLQRRCMTQGTKTIYDVNWDLETLMKCDNQQVCVLQQFYNNFATTTNIKYVYYPCTKNMT